MTAILPGQPTPLRDAASTASLTIGLVGGAVTALGGYIGLTIAQQNAITGLLGLIPGILTAVTAAIAAWRTARIGETAVTPLVSPRNATGQRLVPEALTGRHEA